VQLGTKRKVVARRAIIEQVQAICVCYVIVLNVVIENVYGAFIAGNVVIVVCV